MNGTSITPLNSIHWKGDQNLLDIEKSNQQPVQNINSDEINIMKSYLEGSLKGINNLKETYATDTQTCARIDVILNKIKNILEGATAI